MTELFVNEIVSNKKYKHAIVEDGNLVLSNVDIVYDTDEYNRLVDRANSSDKFYEFIAFYNYAGILTYDDFIGFELNLFEFGSLDDVFDLYNTFNSFNWTSQDKNDFTKIVDKILQSNTQIANLKLVKLQ